MKFDNVTEDDDESIHCKIELILFVILLHFFCTSTHVLHIQGFPVRGKISNIQ